MATFRTGEQTHPGVLPQRRALEFGSVDNPGIRDETGPEHRVAVPGAEHVRGETGTASPGGSGVTPNPAGVGEQGREAHTKRSEPYVFVLDKNKNPLRPCSPARARKLLGKGRAAVHRHTPFTIRLKDRTVAESEVEGVQVGIDPGSQHTGIAVFTHQAGQRRGRYSIQLDHRGARIRKNMGRRSAYRRRRRSANLRHRPPRFSNRTRPRGWLAPSLRHRVETTTSWAARLARWAPLRDAAAAQSTRWALWRALQERLPTRVGSGGRTKWNRARNQLPKSHTLDALVVGEAGTVTETVGRVLVAGCAGRGSYARTRTDRHGFARLRLPRTKRFFAFATSDLVRAVVPTGKKAGSYTGRVAVRASGSFNITTNKGTVQGISHRYVRLLQRADGHAYTIRKEQGVSSRP